MKDRRVYDANLANTILTSLLTITLCSILYPLVWYPALNQDALDVAIQDAERMRLPAVAFISIRRKEDSYWVATLHNDRPAKAVLTDSAGGWAEGITHCSMQPQEEVLSSHYCSCSDMFSRVVEHPPLNQSNAPSMLEGFYSQVFTPSAHMVINNTDAMLVLQVFPQRKSTHLFQHAGSAMC